MREYSSLSKACQSTILVRESEPDLPSGNAPDYVCSPMRKSNGYRNAFCEFMREVDLSDIVFSFIATLIQTIGVATEFCFEAHNIDHLLVEDLSRLTSTRVYGFHRWCIANNIIRMI